MTKADEMKFETTRRDIAESIASGAGDISNPSSWITHGGDSVELRHEGQKIQVRDVAIKPDGVLEGEIFDFSYLNSTQYAGLELNQKLTFTHKHVFHVTRANP